MPPPEGAEPAPDPAESPDTYAVRAACAKAAALLPGLTAGQRINTDVPQDGARFSQTVARLEKARLFFSSHSAFSVSLSDHAGASPFALLCADTVVYGQKGILGKPQDQEEAFAMLRSLAGVRHTVSTGCCLYTELLCLRFAVHTEVAMRPCRDAELWNYIATGEPADKAGAYAIQGKGACLVSSITGSWSNVVGLPFAEILLVLMALDIII